jgi:hypothetical protein
MIDVAMRPSSTKNLSCLYAKIYLWVERIIQVVYDYSLPHVTQYLHRESK